MLKLLKTAFLAGVLSVSFAAAAYAKPVVDKSKVYEGIITQINLGDGSFVLRLRDGSSMTVQNPFQVGQFLSVKGVPENGVLKQVTEMKTKDTVAPDAIPAITLLTPGSATVGSMITLSGTSFDKKSNSISIGTVSNALTNVPSPDGKKITFRFPPAPCNQNLKAKCPSSVLSPGNYDIAVTTKNGVSNAVSFQVTPLPALSIVTDMLPQVTAGNRYKAPIDALGGAEGYVWRVTGGSLPPGLQLAQAACTESPCKSSAMVAGLPTTPGTYQFTVSLTSGQENIARQFSLTVVQPINAPAY